MTTCQKLKKRTFEIIEKSEKGDTVSKIFDICILFLICVNVLSVFAETFKISKGLRTVLADVELFSIIVFSVEFVLRVWTADFLYENTSPVKSKIKYIFSFMALIDLFAILPFYIPYYYKT